MRASLALVVLFLGGCTLMQNLRPENRLADIVYQFNDETRWHRIDLAAQRCAGRYRLPFVRSHARWGHDIAIGDAEVTNLALGTGENGADAQSLVTYQWIDNATMELHSTTVRQDWHGEGEGFQLIAELVVAGEPEIFEEVEGGPQTLEDAMAEDAAMLNTDGLDATTPEAGTVVRSPQRHRDSQGMLVQ
ncbi:MAG: hypothetical protein U0234_27885 [Sandaracinus sp.]